jgi:hypothetical protein
MLLETALLPKLLPTQSCYWDFRPLYSKMERASYYQRYEVILCFPGLRLQHTQLVRNKVNLQAYQREYAQQK